LDFNSVNKWFKVNLLSINVDKTHYIKTKNKPAVDINIACNDNVITTVPKIKFLGLYIHDSLNWSYHIEYIIPKLSSACYIMRSIKPYVFPITLKTVYYSYFNAIISYGLSFWGNSPHAIKIFKMQKRIVRIILGCNNRVSCRNFFKMLGILPLISQYIFLLMLFVVENKNFFTLNSEIYTKVQDKLIIFINPQLIILYTKKKYITRALRFLTIFLRTVKIYPKMLGNLKLV
jgi:hypothetical protein